jgi:peptidoglycan/LPS O-acetylase OafA/YrhL
MALDGSVVQPRPPAPRSHDRLPCLDGVRALAVVSVVVYHTVFFNTNFLTPGGSFFGALTASPWIFFVTSGCLLYLPFAAAHLRDAPAVDPVSYGIHRIARVYPAYWLVLAFFTFVVPRINIYGLHGFLLHTSLTQTYVHINPFVDGLPPAWSLVVEISFYLMLPFYALVIATLARRGRPLAVELWGLAVLFALGLGAIVALAKGVDAPWLMVLPQHLGAFALGMLLAVVRTQRWSPQTSARIERAGRDAWPWWAAAVVAFVAIPLVLRLGPLSAPNTAQAIALNLCQITVGFCIVVPAVLGPQDRGAIRTMLRSRPAVYLGLVSYGIYLWHWYILRIVADWFGWPLYHGNWIVVFAVGLAVSTAAASVSWYALERPVMRGARRLAPRRRRISVPSARDPHARHDA